MDIVRSGADAVSLAAGSIAGAPVAVPVAAPVAPMMAAQATRIESAVLCLRVRA
jgi:hypothetical protein